MEILGLAFGFVNHDFVRNLARSDKFSQLLFLADSNKIELAEGLTVTNQMGYQGYLMHNGQTGDVSGALNDGQHFVSEGGGGIYWNH